MVSRWESLAKKFTSRANLTLKPVEFLQRIDRNNNWKKMNGCSRKCRQTGWKKLGPFSISTLLIISGLLVAWIEPSGADQGIAENVIEPGHSHAWAYNPQDDWGGSCSLEDASAQSPIDIVTSQVQVDTSRTLNYIDYIRERIFEIKKNSHTVSLCLTDPNNAPSVIPSWLDGQEFDLREIHFHWGQETASPGSEHTIDGRRSQAEAHFVHILKGLSKDEALTTPGSILVIGVFVDTGSRLQVNEGLDYLLSFITEVNRESDVHEIDSPRIPLSLLPSLNQRFYSYKGSLTTPPCSEVVNWVVMRDPVKISYEKLMILIDSTLETDESTKKIGPNHRDTQDLAGRTVTASFENQGGFLRSLVLRFRVFKGPEKLVQIKISNSQDTKKLISDTVV